MIHCLKKRNLILVLALVAIHTCSSYSQHRGDNLSIQGSYSDNLSGVKALAMGGAYTAQTGDVSSLFYNPAGLSDLSKIQFNVAGNYNTDLWREHQEWRPDRLFVTLPFYLSGLAPLDPKYDGQFDTARVRDPNYVVKSPKLGLDPYSQAAADWQKTMNKFAISYIAAAIPFTLFDYKFGVAASYNRQNIFDYDRNDTYLDPYIGYFGYGAIPQVNGVDTLVFSWSKFYRQRVGYINNIPLGIGFNIIENLKVGVGVNISWGKTTDYQGLERIGNFTLVDIQKFKFSHIVYDVETNGESTYNSMKFNIGFVYSFDRVNAALKIDLPYTLTRKWNYTTVTTDSSASISKNETGTDKLKFPAVLTFGVSFNPVDIVTISFDYEYAPFSKADFNQSTPDSTFHSLPDQNSYRFGIEYKVSKLISLLAGYQNVPESFIPDGAANKDRGPAWDSYTFGLSLNLFFGRIDATYQWKQLKYYDSYYSNANYQMQINNNIVMGYSYSF
jgi:long-subunit fatty acid transport protein